VFLAASSTVVAVAAATLAVISPITIACNLNPVGVQFALLDPQQ
jgi:hypothetical protein